jgi:hypothetical protein
MKLGGLPLRMTHPAFIQQDMRYCTRTQCRLRGPIKLALISRDWQPTRCYESTCYSNGATPQTVAGCSWQIAAIASDFSQGKSCDALPTSLRGHCRAAGMAVPRLRKATP